MQRSLVALFAALTFAAAGEEPAVRFPFADGKEIKALFVDIDLATKERLYYRFSTVTDSGVELELYQDKILMWRTHVEPIDRTGAKVSHEVGMRVGRGELAGKLHVDSFGRKSISETLDLKTGKSLQRDIRENESLRAR